ncbi:hypothetical protein BKA70DRAFT_1269345 [Coprinopsis sp. MPI-PUGE-AT-0042]|nr:hypothetical protein BKA70DRAFT_1269345 [Coprinopsis sp. MPI-PUGE-AT-0042]
MAQSDGPSIEGDNSMADSRFGTFKGPTQAIHTVSPSPMALASPAPPESLASREAMTKQNKATLPSLFNCTLSALAFSHLRAAQVHATPAASDSMVLVEEDPLFEATVENIAPEEIYDRHTIRPKDGAPAPTFGHRYLASLDLLQKRALVKELGSKNCASQKYTFINIIFEAYPESCALRSKERESEISLLRLCGDLAEGRDTSDGVLWDDRPWLDVEQYPEDMEDLLSIPCINHFVASIILSQVSLEEFVNDTPESRLAIFGRYVGDNTIISLNQELQKHINDQRGVGDGQGFS